MSPSLTKMAHGLRWIFCLLPLTSLPAGAAILTVDKTGPVAVSTGQTFTYALTYTCTAVQQGESCEGAVIRDPMPANVEIVSCAGNAAHQQLPGGVSCPTGLNRTAVFYFSRPGEPANQPGTLPAGSTGTLTINARFRAGATPDGSQANNAATFSSSNATQVVGVVSTTAEAADRVTMSKTRLSSNSVKGQETFYRIQVCQPAGSSIGGLNATNLSIVEEIPAGASYVTGSASNGGIFVAGSPDTLTWGGLSLNVTSGNQTCLARTFSLLYPADFSPTSVTNVARATYTPVGETPKTIEGSVTHGFVTGTVASTLSKNNSGTASNTYPIATEPGFEWSVDASNTGSLPIDNLTITDPVPKQVKVNRISVGNFIPYFSVSVDYQLESTGGTWHALPGNPYTAAADVPVDSLSPAPADDDQITAVRWRYGTVPSGFQRSGAYNRYRVTIQNPDRDGGEVSVGTPIVNTATRTADNLAASNRSNTVTASDGLPLLPRVDKTPDVNSTTPQLSPGSQQTFTLTLTNASATSGPDLRDPVLLDTLPATLEYVRHTVSYGTGVTPPGASDSPVFSQYPNPAGGNVLRWSWPNLTIPQSRSITVSLVVRALSGASALPGQYTNLAMLSGLGNGAWQTGSCRQSALDSTDLDQDGNTTESLCISRNAPVSILAIAGLDSVKEVLGSCPGSTAFASSGQTFGNGPIDYRLTVSNPGNVSVDRAVYYDIFPYVGDTGVIATDSRGSQWAPALAGTVSVVSGTTIAYSQSTDPCRPELFGGTAGQDLPVGCTDDWTLIAPTDITSVKALRIDFGDTDIQPDDQLQFTWPMRAPVSAQIGEMGNNSFGYIATRTDGGSPDLQAAEPNLVVTTIQCVESPPFVGDLVWLDGNENGIQDSGEPGVNGVVVELWSAGGNGQPGGGDDTLTESTVTAPDGAGADGFYRFGDLLPGTYYVKLAAPPGYSISPQGQGGDPEQDSDPDPLTGIAPAISVVSGTERLDIDTGLYPATTATVGNYVWVDRNGNGIQDEPPRDGLNGVPVRLLDSGGTEVASTVTADDGLGSPGFYLFRDVPPGTYYIEVDRGGTFATAFAAASQGTGSDDSRIDSDSGGLGTAPTFTVAAGDVVLNQDAGLSFPTGPLSLGDRVWLDLDNDGIYEPPTETGVNGVQVVLYQDTDGNDAYTPGIDLFVNSATSFTRSGAPGYYELLGLPAGDYLVSIDPEGSAPGGPLEGTVPSTGSGATPVDPDNNVDDDFDQNLYTDSAGNRVTKAIALEEGAEPSGTGNNHNATLDAGFVSACFVICDVNKSGSVTAADLSLITRGRGKRISPPGSPNSGDCNLDGVLSVNDVTACKVYQTP